jgi:hypothetical protein
METEIQSYVSGSGDARYGNRFVDAHSSIEIMKSTLDIKYLERSSIPLHASSIRTRPSALRFLS